MSASVIYLESIFISRILLSVSGLEIVFPFQFRTGDPDGKSGRFDSQSWYFVRRSVGYLTYPAGLVTWLINESFGSLSRANGNGLNSLCVSWANDTVPATRIRVRKINSLIFIIHLFYLNNYTVAGLPGLKKSLSFSEIRYPICATLLCHSLFLKCSGKFTPFLKYRYNLNRVEKSDNLSQCLLIQKLIFQFYFQLIIY